MSRSQRGDIPIISHSMVDNGIAAWTATIKNRRLFNSKRTISLADRGNFCAYTQPADFYLGTRVKALVAKFDSNRYALGFICNLINKQSVKFSYGNNATNDTGKIKILLPVTSSGEPDYEHMERIMRSIESRQMSRWLKSRQYV